MFRRQQLFFEYHKANGVLGEFSLNEGDNHILDVSEHDTKQEAIKWCEDYFKKIPIKGE